MSWRCVIDTNKVEQLAFAEKEAKEAREKLEKDPTTVEFQRTVWVDDICVEQYDDVEWRESMSLRRRGRWRWVGVTIGPLRCRRTARRCPSFRVCWGGI